MTGADSINVRCPLCRARPGDLCSSGNPHWARQEIAVRAPWREGILERKAAAR